MKIYYDRKGLKIIIFFGIICLALNTVAIDPSIWGSTGRTTAVFAPFIILNFLYLIYGGIRHRRVQFFTDWRSIFFLALIEFFMLYGAYIEDKLKNS